MNSPSIFDLSPSEKLQPVEDLWDDLAAAPDYVPVHDLQKQELARRKANLERNHDSGRSWDKVKRRVRTRYAPAGTITPAKTDYAPSPVQSSCSAHDPESPPHPAASSSTALGSKK